MSAKRALRAIDLYSGIGGWSLGLRLAGIKVVASYERWGPANETNFKNNHHQAQTVDIRRLSLADLPDEIDVVVGSPPCTQFSFSNRGGNGDLEDGLQDIITFLKIVDHLKPKAWAMENVPRVASLIAKEMKRGGRLYAFGHLGLHAHIVNMETFGLPQRRKRCIAGNFDMKLLQAYASHLNRLTLGNVIAALDHDAVRDPLYGVEQLKSWLVDHVLEVPLNPEELRINRANKTAHTVYNAMPFPDRLDRPVRTITATCTRVSRESIMIAAPEGPLSVRRLTIRERASLQGFPITFQFYGTTYAQKLRMVGNAIPPAFTYLMGHAFQHTSADALPALASHAKKLTAPGPPPPWTPPDRPGSVFPPSRSFRFAIPSLRLKSGVRFELRNRFIEGQTEWSVDFYFGTSKNIIAVQMDDTLRTHLAKVLPRRLCQEVGLILASVSTYVAEADIKNMQRVWTHKGVGGTRPFMLLDQLDQAGEKLVEVLRSEPETSAAVVDATMAATFGSDGPTVGLAKLGRNAAVIASGLLIGCMVNATLRTGPLKGGRPLPPRRVALRRRS
jgi:DNA (cytosine-5)-methyltransferase 1